MPDKHDALKKLFTDENDVNASELFDILSPFIKINKTNKTIIFLDTAHSQPLKNKVIIFLLAKKALFLLKEVESDRVKPKNIIEETGIPKGSVLPTLKFLKEAKGGSLISSEKGEYYISSYQISKIKNKNILNDYEKNK
ncbi:MAG: hypothetical protein AAB536_02050 [Patescibacteria group bacterium]